MDNVLHVSQNGKTLSTSINYTIPYEPMYSLYKLVHNYTINLMNQCTHETGLPESQ